jgi:hypothetical protein
LNGLTARVRSIVLEGIVLVVISAVLFPAWYRRDQARRQFKTFRLMTLQGPPPRPPGREPQPLATLLGVEEETLRDGWGRPLWIATTPEGRWEVWSYGRDGREGPGVWKRNQSRAPQVTCRFDDDLIMIDGELVSVPPNIHSPKCPASSYFDLDRY